MRFTYNQMRLIKDALDERYETFFRAVMDLAKNKIISGQIIAKCKKDLNDLQELRSKFDKRK